MKKNLIVFFYIILFFMLFYVSAYSYSKTIASSLKDNFFRLHIIANSNSDIDQNLKLKVRDAVLDYIKSISKTNMSKKEIVDLTNENLSTIKHIAQNTLLENGFDYPVSLDIGLFYFPTKKYGNLSLPAGYYDGLKIEIGKADGNNWWCSLFPPLCFIDVSSGVIDNESEKMLSNSLDNEEFSLLTSSSKDKKIKFKIVELFSK